MSDNYNKTIWAFNTPAADYVKRIYDSAKSGKSRFGWSQSETCDLRELSNKQWDEMDDAEQQAMRCHFLLRIQRDDWIVHINTPSYGLCLAVRVLEPYEFDNAGEWEDYRHVVPVDGANAVSFHRNDGRVHPLVSRGLKLRRRQQRVLARKEFFESIDRLNNQKSVDTDVSKELYYLRGEVEGPLQEVTRLIHKTHQSKKLEYLVADVFRRVPGVTDAVVNGSGWGTDHGADVIVTYIDGLPIDGLEETESTLVIQVKSYSGEHWETNAVDQIKTAMLKFDAKAGLLITTAEKTTDLEKALDKLRTSEEVGGRRISIIAGNDVARFMLKHGSELLLGM